MKEFLTILALTLSGKAYAAEPVERLNKNGVALCADRNSKVDSDCYDPVSYFTAGKAEKAGVGGSRKYRFSHENVVYVFASQAHLDLFKQTPTKYLPQYGGWCAYAVATKKNKVDIDPTSFLVQDGRLLLFYKGLLADTRKYWTSDKKKDAKTYLADADANWLSVRSK